MKKFKRRLEQLQFYDYERIEKHLEKMAGEGWLLVKVSPLGWKYEATEPQKLKFTVAYLAEASDFDAAPGEGQQTFLEYCEEAGWKPAAQWSQMQIFYTENPQAVALETEDGVRLAAINEAMDKNFLSGHVALFVLCLLQLFMQFSNFKRDPLDWLSSNLSLATAMLLTIACIITAAALASYWVWYRRAKAAVEEGRPIAGPPRFGQMINMGSIMSCAGRSELRR